MKFRTFLAAAATVTALGFLPSTTLASDHIDGDVTKGHAVGDLTDLYAFPTPGKPGYLTLILNVHPFAIKNNHFSSKVDYTFVIREASIDTYQKRVVTDASSERVLRCTFNDKAVPHTMTCVVTGGGSRTVVFNETGAAQGDLRLFSGHRADSFFFDAGWATITASKGFIPPVWIGRNSMKDLNTLSIVVDVNVCALFGEDVSLLAIVAESLNAETGARFDRVGRPEVTNVTMVAHGDDEDLRDRHNTGTPFDVSEDANRDYRQRIVKNIGYYDALDGRTHWTPEQKREYATIVADDYLLVDVSKPAGEEGYFAIESAVLEGREHTTAGGRLLTDDIMDTLFTKLVNNGQGPRITDGANAPAVAPSAEFPYLGLPSLLLPDRLKAEALRKVSGVPSSAYEEHDHDRADADGGGHPGLIRRFRGHTEQKSDRVRKWLEDRDHR